MIAFGVCVFTFCTMVVTTALASTDNSYGFSFRIQGSVDNAQESVSRFRGTNDSNNAWKVRLDYSGEGENTITSFWIELSDGTNASAAYNFKQGDPAKYKSAYDKGNRQWVYLTGENNNFASTNQYNVSGIWDPETGIYV